MEWSVYDLQDEFTTEEAAYLWIEKEPQYKFYEHPSTVTSLMNTLHRAINNGELRARESGGYERVALHDELSLSGFGKPQYGGIFTPTQYHVTRADLRQWAEKRGKHPAFLFPEHRESASACNATAAADWRADALTAVGASFQKSNADAAGSAVEKARDAAARPEVLPPEPVAHALPAPSGRTRVVGIRKAIEAADAVLTARLGRAPGAREVFDYLAENDETGTVVDHKPDVLIWEGSNGTLHDQTYRQCHLVSQKAHFYQRLAIK